MNGRQPLQFPGKKYYNDDEKIPSEAARHITNTESATTKEEEKWSVYRIIANDPAASLSVMVMVNKSAHVRHIVTMAKACTPIQFTWIEKLH